MSKRKLIRSGYVINQLRQALKHHAANIDQGTPQRRQARRDLDIRLQTVDLCERVLDHSTDERARMLALALVTNLAEAYGIET